MSKAKITIEISECYDRLSINFVKLEKCQDIKKKETIREQIELLEQEINVSIGRDLALKIFKSDEYKELYNVNLTLFNLVDEIKINPLVGKTIDDNVYLRHLAKNKIQKKFFNEEFKEVKLGYHDKNNSKM